MKKHSLMLIFLLLGALNLCAQDNDYGQQHHGDTQQGQQQGSWQSQSPDDRAKGIVSKISEKVEVTVPQKDSLQFIFKKFFTDLQTYKIQDNPAIFDQLKTKRDNAVKRILADDSKYTTYQNFMASMKQHSQQEQGNGDDNQQGSWNHHAQGGDDQDFPGQNSPHQ